MHFQKERDNFIESRNGSLRDNLKGTVPLLALLTAFPALSTDIILPAIPSLARTWNQQLSIKIPVLGAIALGCGAMVLAAWFILQKKRYQGSCLNTGLPVL